MNYTCPEIEGLYEQITSKELGELEPLDIINAVRIKHYGLETGNQEIVKEMNTIEEEYFEGIPALPEGSYLKKMELEKRGNITLEEAEERITKAYETIKKFEEEHDTKLSGYGFKFNFRRLLDRVEVN